METIGQRAFRFNAQGQLSNGSWCGNELKTESPFMRKFIKDALIYWLQSTGLDGYRFDLMGLHDIESLYDLAEELRIIKPDI